ncbi:MAG: hypothetical protein LBS83_02365 [Holosporales bacterium]|nr:hypothetical protein [Holosporales bacterium]
MRILIAANPLKPKKFESAIFWGLGICNKYYYQKSGINQTDRVCDPSTNYEVVENHLHC